MAVRRVFGKHLILAVGLTAALTNCAAPPMGPTIAAAPGPGKTSEAFRSDQIGCQNLAAGQVQGMANAANQNAVGTAVVGTLLGAGVGALTGSAYGNAGGGAAAGAGAGLALGGAVAAANNQADQGNIQATYDNAYAQCMVSRGNVIPGYGYAPQPTAYSIPAADPLVRATQQELVRLGYLSGGADGVAGPMTRSAISRYQSAQGLPSTGQASSGLLARLQSTPTGSGAVSGASTSAPAAGTPAGGTSGSGSGSTASAPTNWVAPTTR
jgi:hypothetical protein